MTDALAPLVHVEHVMGTAVSFQLHEDDRRATDAIADACARLHELDSIFSLWDPESPMSALRAGSIALEAAPPEVAPVLELCRTVRRLTAGWFDPWSLPGGLDPTGLVKGWAIEEAAARLVDAGVRSAVVNGGGDVALLGSPRGGGGWQVGIRHPWRPDALAGVVLATGAVATSGAYERGPHLVDPFTGGTPGRTASATVVGPRLSIADGLATGLAVGGEAVLDRVASLPDYEAYLILADGTELVTDGFSMVRSDAPCAV